MVQTNQETKASHRSIFNLKILKLLEININPVLKYFLTEGSELGFFNYVSLKF